MTGIPSIRRNAQPQNKRATVVERTSISIDLSTLAALGSSGTVYYFIQHVRDAALDSVLIGSPNLSTQTTPLQIQIIQALNLIEKDLIRPLALITLPEGPTVYRPIATWDSGTVYAKITGISQAAQLNITIEQTSSHIP